MVSNNTVLYLIIISLFLCPNLSRANTLDSLDVLIHNHAFKSLVNQSTRTGALYNASLPASLAGMKLSVVRLRSKTLYRRGASFGNFHVPSRTLPVPYVRRLLIVCHDLGNRSREYFEVSGYSMLTSVVGFMVYDSSSKHLDTSNLTRLDLNTSGQPISVEFKNLSTRNHKKIKCATFDGRDRVYLSGIEFPNVCYTRNQGHFSVMLPHTRKIEAWGFWMIGFGLGVVGLAMAGLVIALVLGILRAKRNCEMEKEAEDGEFMESVWIHNTAKMPRAMVTRTHPVIDNIGLH